MFNSVEVAERIKARSKEIGVQLKDVFERSGLNKNMMAGMRNGSMPKADNLAKISEQLNCSVDYLLGVGESKETPAPMEGDGLNENARRFMSLVDGLSPSQQELLFAQLQAWNEQNQRQALAVQQSDGGKALKSDT